MFMTVITDEMMIILYINNIIVKPSEKTFSVHKLMVFVVRYIYSHIIIHNLAVATTMKATTTEVRREEKEQ